MRQFFLGILLLAPFSAWAAPVITTVPEWNGSDSVMIWGTSGSATYGQVFSPSGSDLILQDFSFFVNDGGNNIGYRAYVQQYNLGTNQTVGSILFASASVVTSGAPGFQQIAINSGGLLLNAGLTYVAYLSTSEVPQPSQGGSWGFLNFASSADPNALGYRFVNNGTTFNPATGIAGPWSPLGPANADLAFTANFASIVPVTPELDPTSCFLPVVFLLGLLLVTKRHEEGPP